MKLKKVLRHVIKTHRLTSGRFVAVASIATMGLVAATLFRPIAGKEHRVVYAAAESDRQTAKGLEENEIADDSFPTGIAGVVTSVAEMPRTGSSVKRIGTSFERVMVGQRVKTVESNPTELDLGASMENTVNSFGEAAVTMSASPKMMSDNDYDNLLRIVEAEAGTEDIKGRILVANVIMNRVRNTEFPNSVTDVVWDYSDGVPQFSPTYDGSIYQVTVTEETREAVRQAMEGVDYSEGALFFIQKNAAEKNNITWFEKDLKKLFKYGVHEFYTYPTEKEKKAREAEEKEASEDGELVQMVKK